MYFVGTEIFKKPCESSIKDGGAGYIDKDGNTVKIKEMSIVVDAIGADSTDDEIPTAKAVYDFVTSAE